MSCSTTIVPHQVGYSNLKYEKPMLALLLKWYTRMGRRLQTFMPDDEHMGYFEISGDWLRMRFPMRRLKSPTLAICSDWQIVGNTSLSAYAMSPAMGVRLPLMQLIINYFPERGVIPESVNIFDVLPASMLPPIVYGVVGEGSEGGVVEPSRGVGAGPPHGAETSRSGM